MSGGENKPAPKPLALKPPSGREVELVDTQEVIFTGTREVYPNCTDAESGPWQYTWADFPNGGASEGSHHTFALQMLSTFPNAIA